MKRINVALSLVGFLMFPALTLAQGHRSQAQDEQAQPRMMGMGATTMMMHMVAGPSPSRILQQKQALNLTESQVESLEATQQEAAEARKAYMGQARPLHMQARKALEAVDPDLSTYESALEKLAEQHVKMQVEMARFGQRALQVLSPEQRSNVRYGMRLMREMGGSGMMSRTGMMSGAVCPMMGG